MNRRGFLGSLLALPAALKAKPVPVEQAFPIKEYSRTVTVLSTSGTSYWSAYPYSTSAGPVTYVPFGSKPLAENEFTADPLPWWDDADDVSEDD